MLPCVGINKNVLIFNMSYSSLRNFLVLKISLWLILVMFWAKSSGDIVRIMAVTPSPYGASLTGTSFSCITSETEQQTVLIAVKNNRHVLRGSTYDSLKLPNSSYTSTNNNRRVVNLPATTEAQGMYYCEAFNRGLTTRVPVTILSKSRNMQPFKGKFSVTANIEESVTLVVDVLNLMRNSDTSNLQWEKQSASPEGFEIVQNGSFELNLNHVTVADGGVYATFWDGFRNNFLFSLTRLIVRECSSSDKWGPPSCTGICDKCYNGGICDDKSGECVCRPGFNGTSCLTACGENTFGWLCEHHCGANEAISSCNGSVFCMPDPLGCSCMTGWMGSECNENCPLGMFGAGCTGTCRCDSGTCNPFTGECDGPCLAGWTGPGCQSVCSPPCLNGGSCDTSPDICSCPGNYTGSQCELETIDTTMGTATMGAGSSESSSKPTEDNNKNDGSSDNTATIAAIAGAAAGGTVLCLIIVILIVCCVKRKSEAKPSTRQTSLHATSSPQELSQPNLEKGNVYNETQLRVLPIKGNNNELDAQENNDESPQRNASPDTDSFPEYEKPNKGKKNANNPQTASPTTENIPVYGKPNKEKKDANNTNTASPTTDNIPVYGKPNKGKKKVNPPKTDNIPVYALPNKENKNPKLTSTQSGQAEDVEEYAPVTINQRGDRPPVLNGTNGNGASGWMENTIYDSREEYKGKSNESGWKDNSVYAPSDQYRRESNETEGWDDNKIYVTSNQ